MTKEKTKKTAKAEDKKKPEAKSSESTRTIFGHMRKAISGKIDLALMKKGGATYKEVAEQIGCTEKRVRDHVQKDLKTGMRTGGIVIAEVIEVDDKVELKVAEQKQAKAA